MRPPCPATVSVPTNRAQGENSGPPNIGQPFLRTPLAPRLSDLILKGLVSQGSRGHWGSREPGETWHCRPLAEVPGSANRGRPLRSRGRAALPRPPSPGSALPAPRRTPPAARVFLFPLAASLPPTLRNSSSTCPTGWSTPERLRPHLASGPPHQHSPAPTSLKSQTSVVFLFPRGVGGAGDKPASEETRQRCRRQVASSDPFGQRHGA